MNGIAKKIGAFLTEQKQHKQRTAMFACLAVLVLFVTVTALKLYGQALNHRRDVLECQFEVHEHDEACRDDDGKLVCGYLDYVVHEHDEEFCYDWNGKLTCTLGEYELHEHDEDCYKEKKVLTCEEKEGNDKKSAPKSTDSDADRGPTCGMKEHTHGQDCYSDGEACDIEEHAHSPACQSKELACGQEQHSHGSSCQSKELACGKSNHSHGDGCYDEDMNETCGTEEHDHDDSCYDVRDCDKDEHQHDDGCYEITECDKEEHKHDGSCSGGSELTCKLEEHEHDESCLSEGGSDIDSDSEESSGHVHDDGCYEVEEVLTCKKPELHEHDDDCFDEDGNWTCGEWELLEHQHDEGCMVTRELTPEEIAGIEDGEDHLHTDECYDEDGELICGYPAAHVHEDRCYDEDGNLICGYESLEHVHVDKCYDEDGNLICGYEGSAHLHTPDCYDGDGELICGYASFYHEHDDDCYDEDGNLICGYLEKEHEHTEDCYDKDGNLICKYSDNHLHGPDCYDENGNLICGLEALKHVHTEDCYDEDGNLICGYDEKDFEFRTEVDGITIILSGPPSSFDPDKEYSIEAELVWQEDTISIIEDAMEALEESLSEAMPAAEYLEDYDAGIESATKVHGYYAFDIKLLADGEEAEPLGPVSVRFEGGAVEEAADDEETTSIVLHVDGETGDATDMEAVEEDGGIAFETDHFSIYVYVNLKDILFGKIKMTVEHWGKGITTVDGTAVATSYDDAFVDGDEPHVKTKTVDCEIYSTDVLDVPNEYYADVRALSKVYNAIGSTDAALVGDAEEPVENTDELVKDESLNYSMLCFWVSTDMSNAGQEKWAEGTYEEYELNGEGDLYIRMSDKDADDDDAVVEWDSDMLLGRECLVRFWYEPIEADDQFPTPAVFYDYDITSGQVSTVWSGVIKDWFKIRATPSTSGAVLLDNSKSQTVTILDTATDPSYTWYKIVYHDAAEGEIIGWVAHTGINVGTKGDAIVSEEQGINDPSNFSGDEESRMGVGQQSSGNLSSWAMTATGGPNGRYLNRFNSSDNTVVTGLVGDSLVGGKLSYNVDVPNGDYFAGGKGSTPHNGYSLQFKQDGDTYTLQSVRDPSGQSVTGDLTKFNRYSSYVNGKTFPAVYSNNFWPMDGVYGTDPHMGKSPKQYRFLYNDGSELQKADAPNYSDDSLEHNWHFGMTYKVEFTVGDYTGPMEYYFRGDDDFWLFVDGKLAVDIGGIHSSAGETLDVRKFMEDNGMLEDKNATHYMTIFYMERGGFGSCCYMQFTLPKSVPVEMSAPETTYFEAHKYWDDSNAEFAAFRPESIRVELIQTLNGSESQTGVFAELSESNNWTCSWSGLPKTNGASQNEYSYSYEIREIEMPGYTSVLSNGGTVLTNVLESTSVSIRKSWTGDNGTAYRPESALFQLYYRTEGEDAFVPYYDINGHQRVLVLNDGNGWSGTFSNLPMFTDYRLADDGNSYDASALEYTVCEVYQAEDGTLVPYMDGSLADGLDGSKYEVSYAVDENGTIAVTNHLVSETIIVKKGAAPDGTPSKESVAGAVFTLTPYGTESGTDTDGTPYTGTAGSDGVIIWSDGAGYDSKYVPDGTWLLSEVKAPDNFALNDDQWIVRAGDGEGLPSVTRYAAEGDTDVAISEAYVQEDGTAVLSFDYYDYLVLYELPETGGPGILWYAFAGALAVLAGTACLTYRKRRTGR